MEVIKFSTAKRHDWVDLTDQVKTYVKNTGVNQGLCLVYNPHSTGGLFINSYLDPNTPEDIMDEIDRLVPTRFDFHHQFDTPTDAAGHVKSALMGMEATFIIHDGELMLGHSQGIIFAEFDGPRDRKLLVKVISD
jgi:secondary thiamine-phosphate synthase enzyme